MTKILARIRRLICDEGGPTTVEYAMLVAIIAGGALVALGAFGNRVHALYLEIRGGLEIVDA